MLERVLELPVTTDEPVDGTAPPERAGEPLYGGRGVGIVVG